MSTICVYVDAESILSDIEHEDLIAEIERRLEGNATFKREFCQSEDIQKAFDNSDENEQTNFEEF